MKKKKINIVTLGCSKNLVDSETLATQLNANNFKVVYDGKISSADIVVINTCGFIEDAKEESIDTILYFADAKTNGKIQQLFVIGCLSERYKPSLQDAIPDVDQFFGVNNLSDVLKTLNAEQKNELFDKRIISTPKHYAFLKIAEGCNRACAFCAIPIIRGSYNSLPVETLVSQATNFAKQGTKEILLIAQDTSYYGYDLTRQFLLPELLTKLTEINDIQWIRLHYAYPENFPMQVLDIMQDSPKVCNYIDIPFQHISNNVLKLMRRGHQQDSIYKLIDNLRTKVPNIAIRTTLMVGHPGETQKDFNELKDFVQKQRFDRLGVFAYSHEEDTYAAKNYKDKISDIIKNERASEIMDIQQNISLEINEAKINKTFKTIIDRTEGDYYIGRTQYDSPEVDNEVLIPLSNNLTIGEFYDIKITHVDNFDIFGEPLITVNNK